MTPEETAIFFIDYVPLLKPGAREIYLYCDKLKNKNNIAAVSYAELSEHTGMANSTIRDAIRALREAGLIRAPQRNDGPAVASLGRHEVMPIRSLSKNRRKVLFKQSGREVDTKIRSRAIEMLPAKYRQLLSRNKLTKALVELGPEKFKLEDLTQHFQLDPNVVKLIVSSPKFCADFKQLKTEVLESKSEKKTGLKKKTKKRDSYSDKFEQLMSVHLDKKGNEIPVEAWKPIQLVRHFCVAYHKCKGIDCSVSFGSGLSSKELKHMAVILDKVNGDAKRVKDYIDWAFKTKDKELARGGVTTNFLASGVINEFNQSESGSSKMNRNDTIDSDYMKWVEENVPKLFKQYEFKCYVDLYWIKEALDSGDEDHGEGKVVKEGVRRGILPKKGNLEFSC